MNILIIENMIEYLLILFHMNINQSSIQNDNQFFLFILSMISLSGKSFMNRDENRSNRVEFHILIQSDFLG